MPTHFSQFLQHFLIGGLSIAISIYLLDRLDPTLSGLLIGAPIGILLSYFIQGNQKIAKYTVTHTISILILAIVTVFFYYLYMIKKRGKVKTIVYSMLFWVICVLLLWKSGLHLKIFQQYFDRSTS